MADEKKKPEKKKEKDNKKQEKQKKAEKATKTEDKIKKADLPQKFSSEQVLLEPLTTEKVIRQIELENKIAFIVDRKATKEQIKKELEETFKAKVQDINTQIRNNKKIAFIKLKADTPAIDIATKLGLM
jgi:large subunit ribosomal protein L23